MRTFVCVKHVAESATKIVVNDGNKFDESIKFELNPYDVFAMEEALSLKEKSGGEVVAISVGKETAIVSLREAIAMGADRAILVKSDDCLLDSSRTAKALVKAIEADGGKPDMIFTGKQTIDTEGMQTAHRIAKGFDMPVATNVMGFTHNGETATAECEMERGALMVLELKTPCLIAANKGLNKPRRLKLPAIMKAKKKEVKQLTLVELGIEGEGASSVMALNYPPEKPEAKILSGDAPAMAAELVRLLREEAKVL